jgi:hypothetical protein
VTADTTRRELLKGLSLGAGAAILGPILRQIEAQAAGNAPTPKRVVFVTQSNGFKPGHLVPKGVEWKSPNGNSVTTALTEVPLKDKALHQALEPLTPYKGRLTLVQGLSSRIAYAGHSTNHGALGCYPSNKGPMAQTIDHAVADALPGVFRHVALGMADKGGSLNYSLSASGPGQACPVVCRPDLAFKTLFGSVADGDGRKAFDQKSNLLDFMVDDVKRSRAALGGQDREKLDGYLAAFEAMHGRQNQIAAMGEQLRRAAPQLGEKLKTDTTSLLLEAQFEIGAAALIAGLTNVLLLSSGGGEQRFGSFPEFGIPGLHHIGHGGSYGEKTAEMCFVELRQFLCKLIAGLAKRLESIGEGDGTMLDNTLIVYLSDSADGHHSSCRLWPVVLLGDLGGRIKRTGRFVDYPAYGNKGHRTLANLYCTLLHVVGKPAPGFGIADPALRDLDQTGPLAELLA